MTFSQGKRVGLSQGTRGGLSSCRLVGVRTVGGCLWLWSKAIGLFFCFVSVKLHVQRPQEGDCFAVTPHCTVPDMSLCRVKGTERVWRQFVTKPVVNLLLEGPLHKDKDLVLSAYSRISDS